MPDEARLDTEDVSHQEAQLSVPARQGSAYFDWLAGSMAEDSLLNPDESLQ